MAFSNDKGRHRRGRWWRRGSYLFSRRGEAPPDADRSFWSDDRPDRRERGKPVERKKPVEQQKPVERKRIEKRLETRLPASVVDRPQYTWQDFELDDVPPRAQPNRPEAPPQGDGLRHCGKLERVL
ncbi:MAG: hypothetical protein HOY71_17490, partial [Nonomuraea sp.]|nr:hypothetical protein [Nonomuraea sp.]